ncbi:MAG: HAD-IIIC family phosphatase [Pseudomonadales bacterium]|nr:HAD-IIIC family phosphatase [Pseudomonadales bacterium]
MKFLEAQQLAGDAAEAPEFLLACNASLPSLGLFLAAYRVKAGHPQRARELPFGTMRQHLMDAEHRATDVRVLLPWDFLPELDWRTGLGTNVASEDEAFKRIAELESRLVGLPGISVYLDVPIPPWHHCHATNLAIRHRLCAAGARLGAVLPESCFALDAYLATGSVLVSRQLASVAEQIVALTLPAPTPKKVLVTDLDNVLWHGVIGEDGSAIQCAPEGRGFPHFVYQSVLRHLRNTGAVLVAVSRNDAHLAESGLAHRDMLLQPEDFVAVVASYDAKSAQIEQIARQLNLGLDSFVFVDDNPVELHEVQSRLPEVTTLRYPPSANELPDLCETLARLFSRATVTAEDRQRSQLYRTTLSGMAPNTARGADLTHFLREQAMELMIREPAGTERARALQLINKTNQFNLNGERIDGTALDERVAAGDRLFTAVLRDRFGEHGEILACLVSREGHVRNFVLSCRVFQRRVEYAFLGVLCDLLDVDALRFSYRRTPRNEPVRRFLASLATDGEIGDGIFGCARQAIERAGDDARALFRVVKP